MTNSVGATSSNLRLSGLSSGLDTDTIIKQLMDIERTKVDKVKQKKQLSEWKRDAYREMTNEIRALKDEFFNVLKPTTNVKSSVSYQSFAFASSNASVVSASLIDSGAVTPGSSTIRVASMATAGKATSQALSTPLEGTVSVDATALNGKKLKINLDGITKELSFGNYANNDAFVSDFQSKIDTAFGTLAGGAKKITVAVNGSDHLTFANGSGISNITLQSGSSEDALAALGFSSGSSNRISLSTTLATLAQNPASGLVLSAENTLSVKINGSSEAYVFQSSDSLSDVMKKINSDTNGTVSVKYDGITDQLVFSAKQLGSGNHISFQDVSGSFFQSTFSYHAGQDAEVYINGSQTPLIRGSNDIVVDGMNFSIKKVTGNDTETITATQNTDKVYENIKSFFDKYNALIDKLNGKLSEKYDRDYLPLTDTQKESMSEEDIKKWEEKAKTGLLRNDPILQNMLSDLRRAFSDPVSDKAAGLNTYGISTGAFYERGKININETKLKNALNTNAGALIDLLTKSSTTHPTYLRTMSGADMKTRYQEEGIMQRISDIIENNISTIPNDRGIKGLLIAKAGISMDTSEFKNTLYTEISDYNTRIAELNRKLSVQEDAYYKKFTAMEKALSQMNSQSAWISSQLGGG